MDKRVAWALLDDNDKAEYLSTFILREAEFEFDYDLIQKCLHRLDTTTRNRFLKNMLAEIAHETYAGLSDAQIQSEVVRNEFYFNVIAADKELLGKCLYWAVRGEDM